MVAAGRAMATKDDRRLINDPLAEPLVRAVGIPFFVDMIDGRLQTSPFGDAGPERVQAMLAGMAMRTKFFDEYCGRSTETGIKQVVILASGLDSRAYRLAWPSDAVVYEIDQPAVIDFKTATLAELDAEPATALRTVGVDLRGDWPAALVAAGFDPGEPTAWLAEGLLIYLPPQAQDGLLDTITSLSAPGSAVATEYVPGIVDFDAVRAREMASNMRERGFDIDMPALIYAGPRNNVIEYLRSAGWQVNGVPGDELFKRAGLQPPDRDDYDPLGEIVYVSAAR
jgi:methyltransferase (TIGR00027 family)